MRKKKYYTKETVKNKDISFYYVNQHGDMIYSNSGCSIIGFSSKDKTPEWNYVKNLNG
jgi:hypothetical protein